MEDNKNYYLDLDKWSYEVALMHLGFKNIQDSGEPYPRSYDCILIKGDRYFKECKSNIDLNCLDEILPNSCGDEFLVSYSCSGGFGNCPVYIKRFPPTLEDIRNIEKQISQQNNLKGVIILNFIKLSK